jgi:hypothetical protein
MVWVTLGDVNSILVLINHCAGNRKTEESLVLPLAQLRLLPVPSPAPVPPGPRYVIHLLTPLYVNRALAVSWQE